MVIRPALTKINLWSRSAEELVLGTAIVESGLTYLKQRGEGPALGLWQIEPATHEDLYTNFLNSTGAWLYSDGTASAQPVGG